MAEFFVSKEETEQLGHVVHDKDCAQITPVENFKYLGSFASSDAAYKKAVGFFYQVSYCPQCLADKAAANNASQAA